LPGDNGQGYYKFSYPTGGTDSVFTFSCAFWLQGEIKAKNVTAFVQLKARHISPNI